MGQSTNADNTGTAAAATAGLVPPPKQGTTQQVASSLLTQNKGMQDTTKQIFSALPFNDDQKTRLAGQIFGAVQK